TVGIFGATWIAGIVGGLGESLDNAGVARVGTISRVLVPTDGLWHGAMHAFQDPSSLLQMGGSDAVAFPFLGPAPLTGAYLAWVGIWIAVTWALAAISFARTDLLPTARAIRPPIAPAPCDDGRMPDLDDQKAALHRYLTSGREALLWK